MNNLPLFLSHSLWTGSSKHPYCGRCGCIWGFVAVAGQSTQLQLGRLFLRRFPDQQWMGADGSSLFTWVRVTSVFNYSSKPQAPRLFLHYWLILFFSSPSSVQCQRIRSACVPGERGHSKESIPMKSVEMSSPSSSTPPTTVKPATMTSLCSVSPPQSLLMTILDLCV